MDYHPEPQEPHNKKQEDHGISGWHEKGSGYAIYVAILSCLFVVLVSAGFILLRSPNSFKNIILDLLGIFLIFLGFKSLFAWFRTLWEWNEDSDD